MNGNKLKCVTWILLLSIVGVFSDCSGGCTSGSCICSEGFYCDTSAGESCVDDVCEGECKVHLWIIVVAIVGALFCLVCSIIIFCKCCKGSSHAGYTQIVTNVIQQPAKGCCGWFLVFHNYSIKWISNRFLNFNLSIVFLF